MGPNAVCLAVNADGVLPTGGFAIWLETAVENVSELLSDLIGKRIPDPARVHLPDEYP
jgi:hypothetical protein